MLRAEKRKGKIGNFVQQNSDALAGQVIEVSHLVVRLVPCIEALRSGAGLAQ